jgi:hypothetical protein
MKILDLDKVRDLTNEKLEKIAQEENKHFRYGKYQVSVVECVEYTKDFITESEDVKKLREKIRAIPFVSGCWFFPNHNSIVIEVEFRLNQKYKVRTQYFDFVKIKTKAFPNSYNYRVCQIDFENKFKGFLEIKQQVENISKEVAKEINDKTIEFYSLLKEHNLTIQELEKLNNYYDTWKIYIDTDKIAEKMKGK